MPRRLLPLLLPQIFLFVFCWLSPASAAGKNYTNSLGMEFVLIPAGSFQMGSELLDDEKPVHTVSISKAFYLGKFEVTQEQWLLLMETNPSWFRGAGLPVEQVFWNEAQEFIRRLNLREGHKRYRLPTEAEWEYAAGAGGKGALPPAEEASALGREAWYDRNSGNSTHPVGGKEPNAWGLYDMLGNVNEWVQDWFAGDYYGRGPARDPAGPSSGTLRVRRGGSWSDAAGNCRLTRRTFDAPDSSACGAPGCRLGDLGFRVLLEAE
ncbi:MAG: formylglycine-generating enzyme family protein [Deltaproteobacteria bacterium]|jgi:formylglycine-generating enzyme required for sulfatase activity|nr:formylglycine-generating enzyme family protein [Deltaproteobacteria bacterium]